MVTIKEDEIPEEVRKYPTILYGAGFAGRQCKKILDAQSVEIDFFVDDDRTKWGKYIEGLNVCSYEELVDYCKGKEHCNVILTSIYGVQISRSVEKIPNVTIYEMYDWYTSKVMPERGGEKIYDDQSLKKYKDEIENLKEYFSDEESYTVYQNLYQYMVTGNINYISQISTAEEQYFIKEVRDYFGDRAISVVDAGAYEGELIRTILDMNLNVKEWFCFETNKENYRQMVKNSNENGFKGSQICVNKGLWDRTMSLSVEGSGASSKVVDGGEEQDVVEMTTIDEYFKDIHIDLVKMDIEGAETNALNGGLEVIKRDRPVLAISIYHSIEDYYEIMKILIRELQDYKYYVRHHSLVFCETVLYAIPKGERNK